MLKLPEGFRGIAPDLRGYGDTEDKLIDATRGMSDWVDDLLALLDALKWTKSTCGRSLDGRHDRFGLVAGASGPVS
jgi:pimeloyl-ACP methyl ester carboxylesterase